MSEDIKTVIADVAAAAPVVADAVAAVAPVVAEAKADVVDTESFLAKLKDELVSLGHDVEGVWDDLVAKVKGLL
jgi:hypothetical protein